MFARQRKSKKAKSGFTWTIYIDYVDSSGMKKRYTKGGFKTKKEALEHGGVIEQHLKLNNGELFENKKTFNQIYDEYMEIEGKYKYSKNTKIQYDNVYKNHIKNSIGLNKIINLRYKNIQEYFNGLDSLGKVTCEAVKKILNLVFKYSLKNGYIQTNPMPMIEIRGQDTTREKGIIEYDQLEDLIDSLKKEYKEKNKFSRLSYCIFLYLSYFLGTRKAETLALKKEDVDFENNCISINKQLDYRGVKRSEFHSVDCLKTKSSNAIIPMCSTLKSVLEEWITINPYDLLCCDENGDYLVPESLNRCLRDHAEKLGFSFRPHMLRHTFVTNLVRSGTDIKTVSELARHSNVTTTMNVYAQTTERKKSEAIKHTFNGDFAIKSNKKVTNSENALLN